MEKTEKAPLSQPTGKELSLAEVEDILKNPWDIDGKREPEKQQLYAQLKPMQDDLLKLSYETFSEETADRLVKILECLKKLNPTNYDQDAPRIVEFTKRVFDPALKKWEKRKKQLDLREVNQCLRQLYELGGSYSGTEASQYCSGQIRKIDLLLQETFAAHPKKLKDYLDEKEQEIRAYGKKLKEEDQKTLEGLLGPFVLNGYLSSEGEPGKETYYKEFEGERWIFKIMYGDPKYPTSAYVAIVSEKNPRMLAVYNVQTNTIFKRDDSTHTIEGLEDLITQNRFGDIMKEAKNNYENESQNKTALSRYDLPKDRPIYYLRIFHESWDNAMENLQSSMMMSSVLSSRYPNLTVAPILFSDQPAVTLKENIREAYEKGTRSFYFDIQMHGLHHQFISGEDYKPSFAAPDLLALEQEFPGATFHVSTAACFGAGAREDFLKAFEEGTASKDKFSLFLQTKPTLPTVMGLTGKETSFGIYYDMILMQSLLAGKTYGEAVYEADTRAKEIMYLDAEEIIDGQLITMNESKTTGTVSA